MKYIPLFIMIFLVGCGGSDQKYSYKIQNTSYENSDIQTLINRLEEISPSYFTKVEYQEESNVITISGDSPSEEAVKMMGDTLGNFLIQDGNGDVWVTSDQVVSTNASMISDKPVVTIMLNEEGAEILSNKSISNIGNRIVLSLDNTILVSAKIEEELGGMFRISSPSMPKATNQAAIIKHGKLKNKIILERW